MQITREAVGDIFDNNGFKCRADHFDKKISVNAVKETQFALIFFYDWREIVCHGACAFPCFSKCDKCGTLSNAAGYAEPGKDFWKIFKKVLIFVALDKCLADEEIMRVHAACRYGTVVIDRSVCALQYYFLEYAREVSKRHNLDLVNRGELAQGNDIFNVSWGFYNFVF